MTRIFQLIGIAVPTAGGGGRGGGGGFGGGGGAGATTGDYGVVLTVGGTTVKKTLRVENTGAGPAGNPFGPASGDDDGKAKTPKH